MREKKMRAKLEDFLQEVCEKTITNNQYPVLTSSKSGLFLQSDYFNKQVASKDNTGYKIIRRGQFTYRAMSDTGEFFPNMLECADVGIVSPAYPVFEIIKQDQIVPEYLNYYFKSNRFQNSISTFAQGSTRTSVKFGKLKKVSIELPEIKKQYQIIRTLDLLRTIINNRKKEVLELDELIRARFVEMFGDNDKKIAISSLCDVSGGYSFKSEDISSTGFIKILQIGNVYLDDVNWETTNYLPKGFDNVYSRFLLNEGDIVIALTRPIIQSLGNVKACIVKVSDTPCLLNQRVGRIVSKKNVDVNLKFIYGCLMTDDFTRYVESCCIGCSQPNISTKDIENYMIPDASYEKQMDFVKFKEQVDKSKATVQKALDETQLLFDSLMQQYFG